MRRSLSRVFLVVIGAGVTLLFFWLAFAGRPISAYLEAVSRIDPRWAAAGVGLILAGYTVRLFRWRAMLSAIGVRPALPQLVTPFLGSFALNNVLPLRAGDAFRVVGFTRSLRARSSHVLATLVVERILDFCSLLTFLAVAAAFSSQSLPEDTIWVLAAPAMLLCPIFFIVLGAPKALFRMVRVTTRLLVGVLPGLKVVRLVRRIALRTLIGVIRIRSAFLPGLFGLSLVAWLLEAGVVAVAVLAVGGGFEPAAAMFATAAASLATLAPSAPGYFGTFHFFGALALENVGIPAAEALVSVTFAHLILWGTITLTGLLVLALHFVKRRVG